MIQCDLSNRNKCYNLLSDVIHFRAKEACAAAGRILCGAVAWTGKKVRIIGKYSWVLTNLWYNRVMITEKVRKTILDNKMLDTGAQLVVGLSGGPDSVCLFHLLYRMREALGLTLHAVHVNHKFRPGAAEEDQAYVEALCRRLDIPCHVFVYDCARLAREQGISGEEAGRNARYEAFYRVAGELAGSAETPVKIAVAHNADDQAETVLFRLLRGTGTDGLSGMEYKRAGKPGIEIIRPLLDVRRWEIEDYCLAHGLAPRRDATNEEAIYTRNKIRLELIPYLRENFNQNVTEALLRLSKIVKEDKNHLWGEANALFSHASVTASSGVLSGADSGSGGLPGGIALECAALRETDSAVRRRVILKALRHIGLERDVSEVQLAAADRLIREAGTGAVAEFPHGYRLRIEYGRAIFYRKDGRDGEAAGRVGEAAAGPELCVRTLSRDAWKAEGLPLELLQNGFHCGGDGTLRTVFDFAALQGLPVPVLRSRQPGDWFRPRGFSGRKKLQDFFVDQKVPRQRRDSVLLAAAGSEILWIIGDEVGGGQEGGREVGPGLGGPGQDGPGQGGLRGRITENYRISSSTETILLLELVREL